MNANRQQVFIGLEASFRGALSGSLYEVAQVGRLGAHPVSEPTFESAGRFRRRNAILPRAGHFAGELVFEPGEDLILELLLKGLGFSETPSADDPVVGRTRRAYAPDDPGAIPTYRLEVKTPGADGYRLTGVAFTSLRLFSRARAAVVVRGGFVAAGRVYAGDASLDLEDSWDNPLQTEGSAATIFLEKSTTVALGASAVVTGGARYNVSAGTTVLSSPGDGNTRGVNFAEHEMTVEAPLAPSNIDRAGIATAWGRRGAERWIGQFTQHNPSDFVMEEFIRSVGLAGVELILLTDPAKASPWDSGPPADPSNGLRVDFPLAAFRSGWPQHKGAGDVTDRIVYEPVHQDGSDIFAVETVRDT